MSSASRQTASIAAIEGSLLGPATGGKFALFIIFPFEGNIPLGAVWLQKFLEGYSVSHPYRLSSISRSGPQRT